MEVELVIVRHGETEANKCHIIQGHQDTALSELGLQQAQCVAKYLGRKYFLILVDALLNNEQRTSTNFLQKLCIFIRQYYGLGALNTYLP